MGLFSFFDKAKRALNTAKTAIANVFRPKPDAPQAPDSTQEGFAYRVAMKLGTGYFKRRRMSRAKRVQALCQLNALEFAFAVANNWVPAELQLSMVEYRVRNKLGASFFSARITRNMRIAKLMSLDQREYAFAFSKGWVPDVKTSGIERLRNRINNKRREARVKAAAALNAAAEAAGAE